ncbi:MAG: hypothetical protein R3C97_09170 [Geminicoccaceae bacterium]
MNGDTGVTVSADADIAGVHISGTADVVTGTGQASITMATTATGTATDAAQQMTFTYTDQAGDTFTATVTAASADKAAYSGAVVFEGTGVTLALDSFDSTTAITGTAGNISVASNDVSFQVGVDPPTRSRLVWMTSAPRSSAMSAPARSPMPMAPVPERAAPTSAPGRRHCCRRYSRQRHRADQRGPGECRRDDLALRVPSANLSTSIRISTRRAPRSWMSTWPPR